MGAAGMSEGLEALAASAGLLVEWRDYRNEPRRVSPDSLRAVLAALGLPAGSEAQIAESRAEIALRRAQLPALITATVDTPLAIPLQGRARIRLEDGGSLEVGDGRPPVVAQPGYHVLETGERSVTLAVAPSSAWSVAQSVPGRRPWALAVQLYALRRAGDGGLGDFRALAELAGPAARAGASAIAISPVHAQFSADIHRFSPYSPSSRTRLNVLHAGIDLPPGPRDGAALIDWPAAARARLAALARAFASAGRELLAEFARFREAEGDGLQTHAVFEALHAEQFGRHGRWHWRTWPEGLRDPASPDVAAFARAHAAEVDFHAFAQFLADRSLAAAQAATREAGMGIGLIADLAVGVDSGGSQCWSRQTEMLPGMTIGAPPDLLSRDGQSWGLSAFSPTGLREHGYRAFREMLRSAMAHAGGVRIDHALGLRRLWVIPEGASAAQGTYLQQPTDDLLRLIALESHRHRTIVVGEDLGTIPEGFQERMAAAGMLGMRVLWFEKQFGLFTDPRVWTREAAAMTSTHDLPTVAGWWLGHDIEVRAALDLCRDAEAEWAERETDRAALWAAFGHSGAAEGERPQATAPVLDAACRHLARAACEMVILPIEDAVGLTEQPNLPGTRDEQHPNWRRRLPQDAPTLLAQPAVAARLAALDDGAAAAPQAQSQSAPS